MADPFDHQIIPGRDRQGPPATDEEIATVVSFWGAGTFIGGMAMWNHGILTRNWRLQLAGIGIALVGLLMFVTAIRTLRSMLLGYIL